MKRFTKYMLVMLGVCGVIQTINALPRDWHKIWVKNQTGWPIKIVFYSDGTDDVLSLGASGNASRDFERIEDYKTITHIKVERTSGDGETTMQYKTGDIVKALRAGHTEFKIVKKGWSSNLGTVPVMYKM